MATHAAVLTTSPRAPLSITQVPTIPPSTGEVLVKVQWTASTPLDLYQNDGGLLVNHPQVLGDGIAGIVVELGTDVKNLKIGDKVFGFTWRSQKEKAHQERATIPEYLLGNIPSNFTPRAAVTLCSSLVTVFHSLTADLDLPLPWPHPSSPPEKVNTPILIWGGSSSVGQYALQVLAYYGYKNLLTTSSPSHHEMLKELGGGERKVRVFDYRSEGVVKEIADAVGEEAGRLLVLDYIGSKDGSLALVARIARRGAKVAVLLPVIVKDATEGEGGEPIYAMDSRSEAGWEEGVVIRGVRTHFYLENEVFKEKLQSDIVPTLLEKGIVKPNQYRIVEGETLL